MKTVKALIFDFNGTLFWDTHYHQKAWASIAERYGRGSYSEAEMHFLNGKTNKEVISFLVGSDLPEERIRSLSQEKEELYIQLCQEAKDRSLAPGALALFERAQEQGLLLAIATSAGPSNMNWYRSWFPLDRYFKEEFILTDNGIRKSKPHPAIYLDTLSALGLPGSSCIVFEDTKAGILSAHRAGIGTIYAVASTGADLAITMAMDEVHGHIKSFDEILLEQ